MHQQENLPAARPRRVLTIYGLMCFSFIATGLLAVIITPLIPETSIWTARQARVADRSRMPAPGTRASLSAGDVSIQRTFPALNFALEPGQTLDARLPSGPFNATFTVTLDPGRVRQAWIGVDHQGGQVIVRDGGEVLVSDIDLEGVRRSMSSQPIDLPARGKTLTFEYRTDGARPMLLRPLWRPLEAEVVQPLPTAGAPVLHAAALRGEVLAQQFSCARCHQSGDLSLQKRLLTHEPPDLSEIGARARPEWLRRWIADPHAVKPARRAGGQLSSAESAVGDVGQSPRVSTYATRMPDLAHDDFLSSEDIEDLTHYLGSLGGPLDELEQPPAAELVATGRVLYHNVGCVACHGPIETLGALSGGHSASASSRPWKLYSALGAEAAKTTVAQLAAFLENPLPARPSGEMPSMLLSVTEAEAIAAYLIAGERPDARPSPNLLPEREGPSVFELDAQRVRRGRDLFQSAGCAACHPIGAEMHAPPAPPLESLADRHDHGCLSPDPTAGTPDFHLSLHQREDLADFIDALPARRNDEVPLDHLAIEMRRLNCFACHSWHSHLGPEPAIAAYFDTSIEADLGDEGRIPPSLTDAGARLTTQWMHDVLSAGQRARPYLATRMPQFGATHVDHLPRRLVAAAGMPPRAEEESIVTAEKASLGRQLVGSRGFNCIQCHEIGGHDATGTPGPDLALMPGRLQPRYFQRWMHDPSFLSPGTRMPTFFVYGQSAQTEVLGGRAEDQIDAIWSYLCQGEALALPEGLPDPEGFELTVAEEPLVFRTFMAEAGVRAIACGFPEQVHCAFDADRCRLALAWEGQFLNAQGAWGARGGTETNPLSPSWMAPEGDLLSIVGRPKEAGRSPVEDNARKGDAPPAAAGDGAADDPERQSAPGGHSPPCDGTTRQFLGYRLDEQRRPIFQYELRRGEVEVLVTEQPLPSIRAGRVGLHRIFTLDGPPGTSVAVSTDLPLGGDRLMRDGEGAVLTLDESGRGEFVLEVRW